ncbi:MAG: phosphotransferase family protein [Actinomycetota bacterium]
MSSLAVDLDPGLPELAAAFDLPLVSRWFVERWPGLGRVVNVTARRVHDTKYEPSVRCVIAYDLLVERAGEDPQKTIGVAEIGPAGTRLRLYDQDPRMPWLQEATAPQPMSERFARLPEFERAASGPPRITALRYKAGVRCALRYDLPVGDSSARVFGKMLVADGARIMSTLDELHELSRAEPEMPRIARPLVYWSDIHVLAQYAVVDGRELHEVVFDLGEDPEVRLSWIRTAGARLAGLHAHARTPGPHQGLLGDAAELDGYAGAIGRADAALADAFADAIELLRHTGEREPDAVASHGAFRTDQFMIQDGRLVMIDLDSYCWADPARDIGNLFAYLRWKSIRQPQHADFIASARGSFLEGYGEVRDPPSERWSALYEAASMLKVAGRRYRSLTVREWPVVPRLIYDARALARGRPAPY